MSNKKIPKVVILGGGFGGVYTARYLEALARAGEIELVLINKTNYFLFTPLLHEVATGGLTPTSVIEPIREIFRDGFVKFIQAEVKAIDTKHQLLRTTACKINYDYLVISPGAETNFYNTPGAEKHSLGLKNLSDALKIRNKIINAFETASFSQDTAERRRLLSAVVIGGGPTGVELAGELAEFMGVTLFDYYRSSGIKKEEVSVTLVCTSPDILPQFPVPMRSVALEVLKSRGVVVRLNTRAVELSAGQVKLDSGEQLDTETILWVAGVSPKPWAIAGAESEASGRLRVDENLRLVGVKNIFSLGDVSGTSPMLAQVAVQQAKTVAHNIEALMTSTSLRSFRYFQKGLLVSLGQWSAVGHFFGATFSGRLMWWVWRTVYLFNFLSWRKRFKIAAEWTINLFYPRDISRLS